MTQISRAAAVVLVVLVLSACTSRSRKVFYVPSHKVAPGWFCWKEKGGQMYCVCDNTYAEKVNIHTRGIDASCQ